MSKTETFTSLLTSHLPKLRAYALVLTRNHNAADDLLQDTACRAWRAQHQFAMGTNFTAWIYRILRNSFLASLRRAQRTLVPLDEVPDRLFSIPPEQDDIVLSRQIVRVMDKIRPGHKQVLTLVCAEGMSYTAAAKVLNCTVASVKSKLWRARQHMELLVQESPQGARRRPPAPIPKSARVETPLRVGI
ncbi:MAG: sigma-70 family RNA polymerase sigma factor [Rhodospirillaceae bacterium]